MSQNALERIDQAIASLDSAAPAAHPGLAQARDRLLGMRRYVLEPPSPERGARASDLARMVTALWPVDSHAREHVVGAVQAFLRLRNEPLREADPTCGAIVKGSDEVFSDDDMDLAIASW